jgi:phosphotransferase system enzyme I (PtsI)
MDEATNTSREVTLQGIPVSRGIGIAPIHVVARGFTAPEVYRVSNVESEKARFQVALEKTKVQLAELQQRIEAISGEKDSQIFEAHLMML